MKKLLLVLLALLVVAAGVVWFAGGRMVSQAVRTGVETAGPKLTGTSVELADVGFSVLDGTATIEGLVVGNAPGFEQPKAFSFGRIHVDVDTLSVLGSPVVVREVRVEAPEFVFEQRMLANNLKRILDHVEEEAARRERQRPRPAPKEGEEPAEEPAAETRFQLHQFVLEGGKVTLASGGKVFEVPLPRIEVRDLGTDRPEGVTASEATKVVLERVLDAAILAGLELAKNPEAVRGLLEQGEAMIDDAARSGGDAVRGIMDQFKPPPPKP